METTKKKTPQKKAKRWSEMTYEERRSSLPEKLNKLGEMALKSEGPLLDLSDMTLKERRSFMRAVLK